MESGSDIIEKFRKACRTFEVEYVKNKNLILPKEYGGGSPSQIIWGERDVYIHLLQYMFDFGINSNWIHLEPDSVVRGNKLKPDIAIIDPSVVTKTIFEKINQKNKFEYIPYTITEEQKKFILLAEIAIINNQNDNDLKYGFKKAENDFKKIIEYKKCSECCVLFILDKVNDKSKYKKLVNKGSEQGVEIYLICEKSIKEGG